MTPVLFDQRVFYFPLKPRLEALMETKVYFNMCQHEFFRPKNKDILTDVYDSPAWKDFMGPCNYPNKRLGLLGCGDGFPAFDAGTLSLKPWMFKNMSLAPSARSKTKYMLLYMLFQDSIKAEQQRKYFEFAAHYELRGLFDEGIKGGIKVKVFSTAMDTKGREELSGIFLASHSPSSCVYS